MVGAEAVTDGDVPFNVFTEAVVDGDGPFDMVAEAEAPAAGDGTGTLDIDELLM